jgi:hypothetical protein
MTMTGSDRSAPEARLDAPHDLPGGVLVRLLRALNDVDARVSVPGNVIIEPMTLGTRRAIAVHVGRPLTFDEAARFPSLFEGYPVVYR